MKWRDPDDSIADIFTDLTLGIFVWGILLMPLVCLVFALWKMT